VTKETFLSKKGLGEVRKKGRRGDCEKKKKLTCSKKAPPLGGEENDNKKKGPKPKKSICPVGHKSEERAKN